jgi:uridine phosphorylase
MKCSLQAAGTQIAETELILRPDGTLYHLGIDENHIADKVIIVGDPDRVDMIGSKFDQISHHVRNREFVCIKGSYQGKDISVISSGIGVDNIDILMNELDAAVNVDLKTRTVKSTLRSLDVVRIGTTGGLRSELVPGTFVASSWAVGLDNVALAYNYSYSSDESTFMKAWTSHMGSSGLYAVEADQGLLTKIGHDMVQGITLTANGFYGPQGRSVRAEVRNKGLFDELSSFKYQGSGVTNLEMECSGIYALSSMLGHKALTVCVVLANRLTKEFHKEPSVSIESLVNTVLQRI